MSAESDPNTQKKAYDLNVDSYTDEELVATIKYGGQLADATPRMVSAHINKMIVQAATHPATQSNLVLSDHF